MRYVRHPSPPQGWPERVPVLAGENICRGIFFGSEESACFLGWKHRSKLYESIAPSTAMCRFLGLNENDWVTHWSDATSPAVVAAKWNEWVASLGYTEPA